MEKLVSDKKDLENGLLIVAVEKNNKDILSGKVVDQDMYFVDVLNPLKSVFCKIKNTVLDDYNIYAFNNEKEYLRFLSEKLNSFALDFDVEHGPTEE